MRSYVTRLEPGASPVSAIRGKEFTMRNEPYKVIELPNNTALKIYHDDNAESPREEWDHPDIMACFHKRYNLGDPEKRHGYNSDHYDSWEEMAEAIEENEKPLIIQPLYLYDHGGLTISTGGFSCPWDSGQIGFIWITEESLSVTHGSDSQYREPEYLKKIIEASVDEYDKYLRGDIYGFQLIQRKTCDLGHTHEDIIDSCWGFYGDNVLENGMLDHLDKEDSQYIQQQLTPSKRSAV